jgi:DNA-binding transcriptional regulator GbsR (MarR family)
MAIKELMSVGIVYRVNVEGQKKLFYRSESDLWMMATQIFKKRARERLILILRQLEAAEHAFQAEDENSSQSPSERDYKLGQVGRLVVVGKSVIGLLDAIMERTKVEVVAAQKWRSVSEKLGGEPLSRLRRAINASRMDKRRR